MMTRKDYVETAAILAYHRASMPTVVFDKLVREFGDMFARDNDAFKRARFESACYHDAPTTHVG